MPKHTRTTSTSDAQPVRYMDGSSLNRPFDMPAGMKIVLVVLVAAAVVIGIIMGQRAIGAIWDDGSASKANVEAAINRGVTLDLPILTNYLNMNSEEISAQVQSSGAAIIDYNAVNNIQEAHGLDLIKLPSDVTAADAAIVYAGGLNKLNAEKAATYLTGSWRLQTADSEYVDYRVKYADFTSQSAEAAINTAMASEGFVTSADDEMGVDHLGNTFHSGVLEIDGTTYHWQVSVCALKEVYDIAGLPSTAQYVGVRLYQ